MNEERDVSGCILAGILTFLGGAALLIYFVVR